MIFQDVYFILFVSTGLATIIASWLMKKYPPKKINNLYGYRTKRSKKSKEAWDFAQTYSADSMGTVGAISGIVGIILGFCRLPINNLNLFIAVVVLLVVMFIPIYKTEKALKERFEKS